MSKIKLLKYPKKPKKTASISVMENYLAKIAEVNKENARRKSEQKKKESLVKRIAGIGKPGSVKISTVTRKRKKTSTSKKKKSTTRRKSRR